MSTRPAVPPLRRRPPPEAVVPTHEPAPTTAPKNAKVMVYMPAEMVDELDQLRVLLRRQFGANVDRSAVVRAAIRLGMARPEDWADKIADEAGDG